MASDGSSSVVDRSSRPPSRRTATRLESLDTCHSVVSSVCQASSVNQSRRGPGSTAKVVRGRATGARSVSGSGCERISDRELHAGRQRLRSQSGQHVGRSAAERRGRLEAAPDGQVAAEPLRAAASIASVSPGAAAARCASPPGAVHQHVGRRSGDRDPVQRRGRHHEAAEQALDGGRVLGVADQPVGQPERRPVGRPRRGDAQVRVACRGPGPAAAPALRSGRRPARQPPSATKRTTVPGCSSAGGVRSRSHSDRVVCPISCQPPGPLRG